jgi:BirA family biotin operon repressor/biotin-[acetyl-CoA-carboxylase] ligase
MFRLEDSACIHFTTLDSTNTWAKTHYKELRKDTITCITADSQTQGRGRWKRTWLSPSDGGNIYATFFFYLPGTASYIPNLTQILALSCCEILRERSIATQIKWPNDLIVKKEKIGGILCETILEGKTAAIILGLGLNVNMSEQELKKIEPPATSLAKISGMHWDKNEILKSVLQRFLTNLNQLQTQGFLPFKDLLESLLAFKGETICFHHNDKVIQGMCHSLTKRGFLNVVLPNGETQSFSSGEIETTY